MALSPSERARRKSQRAVRWRNRYEEEGNPDESLAEFKKRWARERKESREAEREAKKVFMQEIDATEEWQEFPGQTREDWRRRKKLQSKMNREERKALRLLGGSKSERQGSAGRGVEQMKALMYDGNIPGMLGGGKVYGNSTRKSQYKAG